MHGKTYTKNKFISFLQQLSHAIVLAWNHQEDECSAGEDETNITRMEFVCRNARNIYGLPGFNCRYICGHLAIFLQPKSSLLKLFLLLAPINFSCTNQINIFNISSQLDAICLKIRLTAPHFFFCLCIIFLRSTTNP